MKYKIITLDGGGIKGLISIVVMQRLLKEVPELFNIDLMAGTSTGGIIALALSNKCPDQSDADRLTAIEKLYYDKGSEIFKKKRYNLWDLFSSKYSNKGLLKLLEEFFGDVTLGQLDPVLIPAFDLDRTNGYRNWAPKFFDNLDVDDRSVLVRDVAAYTSAAPTYFPSYDGFVDGGVCANNPSMAALAAEIDKGGAELSEIRLLSIGTGQGLQYIKGNVNWGLYKWASKVIDIMFDGLSNVPDFQCRALLKDNYCRIDPRLGDLPKIDDFKARDYLVEVGNTIDLKPAVEWLKEKWN